MQGHAVVSELVFFQQSPPLYNLNVKDTVIHLVAQFHQLSGLAWSLNSFFGCHGFV